MNAIDQNTSLASLQRNLLPGRVLIDDRTEPERLSFLAEFASLINFYNGVNQLSGDWTPFLLKDPVFLMASISQTRFERWYALYTNVCLKVEKEAPLTLDSKDLGDSFNELFDQFINVFLCIERWTSFMLKAQDDYELRTYVLNKVENVFSRYLWALASYKEAMYIVKLVPGLAPVPYYKLDIFNAPYNFPLWTLNKDKNPYWEVLGLDANLGSNSADQLFSAFKNTGDALFGFFHTIISHSGPQYDKLSAGLSSYPDTTLLRTFISLLKNQQEQLNTLSAKHLEFYYHDILKQYKRMAVPDHVIISTELAKKDEAFLLPAGTVFEAGIDPDKNPVEFASTRDVSLNPAVITAAYTLSRLPVEGTFDMLDALYFQAIPDPGTLKKEEDGTILQWETFGGATPSPASQIRLGFSFASPLLLLREGNRTITVTMEFEQPADFALLSNAAYALSTVAAWLPVNAVVSPGPNNTVVIVISLDATQPAVEKFAVDPDGLDTAWPVLKIEFSHFCNMSAPPVLTDLQIDVDVQGVKNLQQYNDDGLLVTKTPYQLFGPIPLQNSNFIVGSNEIFSKPFDYLVIELDWDALPSNFADYYSQYNAYLCTLKKKKSGGNGEQPELPILPAAKTQPVFSRFTSWLGSLFKRKQVAETSTLVPPAKQVEEECVPEFSNYSFTVDFQLLNNQQWQEFDMVKEMPAGTRNNPYVPYKTDCKDSPEANASLLFSTDADCKLTNYSFFGYNGAPVSANPYIQDVPLVFTDTTATGFMRMTLTAPGYGFGSALYPQLVADIAFRNAAILVNTSKGDTNSNGNNNSNCIIPDFIKPAVLPYVPQLIACTASYSATHKYDLRADKSDYPLQCYFYSPFESYPVYSSTPGTAGLQNSAGLTVTGIVWQRSGLPLFPQVDYKGNLFLEIANLVPAESLSIFFELSRKYGKSPGSRDIDYFYLSTSGWKPLNILEDGTNNFTCSGIIKTNIPLDMADGSFMLPEKKFWFAFGVKDDPGSFAETVYLKTNGFVIERTGTTFLPKTEKPWIPANAVTQTKLPLPQIAAIAQPFPSTGGRPAETEDTMNRRVSDRLKTKDRVVTAEDYFRLIRQEFDDIYYSKVIYNAEKKATEVYVVKAYDSSTDANAFIPLVSECRENKIEQFLKARASAFANINVYNFNIEYVRVKAVVIIKEGYEESGVRKSIINAINIFLSPWILSLQKQVAIDQGLSDAELAGVIRDIDGVFSVESILFQTGLTGVIADPIFTTPLNQQGRIVMPLRPSNLFVPYPTHEISFRA